MAVKTEHLFKIFRTESDDQKFTLAVKDVSLEINEGSLTVIGGANGSGKSVLVNMICGLVPPTQGNVFTKSKPGIIFQDATSQILGDTLREDVAVGPKNLKINKKEIPEIVERCLKSVNLWEKADFPCEFLSGGEKRRLAVASILAMNREIIIFDEPYANLDYPGVKDVNSLIKKLHEDGKTIIILTHELEKILGLSDHFIVLSKGEKVFDGKPEQALELPVKTWEEWAIRHPLNRYDGLSNLVWE